MYNHRVTEFGKSSSPSQALKPQCRSPGYLTKIVLPPSCLLGCCSHMVNSHLQSSFLNWSHWQANSGFPSYPEVRPGFLHCPLMSTPGLPLPGYWCLIDKPSSFAVHGQSFPGRFENIRIRCAICVTSHLTILIWLGKVSKKIWKKYGLLPNQGGWGQRGWRKNQTAFLKKGFFREYLESF